MAQNKLDAFRELSLFPEKAEDVKISELFSTAKYNMQLNSTKAWLFLTGMVQKEPDNVSTSTYTFDALQAAERFKIDKRKSRPLEMYKIFKTLLDKKIELQGPIGRNGLPTMEATVFATYVKYNDDDRSISVTVNDTMKRIILADESTHSWINEDIDEILSLNRVASLSILIYLRTLETEGRDVVTVQEFRRHNPYCPSDTFYDYKKRILRPALQEIHRHTHYKNLTVEDNGKRGRAATLIFFSFSGAIKENAIEFQESNKKSDFVNSFSDEVQAVIAKAESFGFKPEYIHNQFDKISDKQIIDNFYIVFDQMTEEKKSGKYKGNEVYSKYFIPAVLQNWAENEANKKKVEKKAASRKKRETAKKREKDITERLIEEAGGDDCLLENIKKTSPELARTIERITKNLFAKASKSAQ